MKVLGFPFRQVGELLRNMSLSGTSGNVCAWGIYVILCLIPVAVLIAMIARKKAKKIDFCLIPIAIAEAAALYLSVNPLLIGDWDMRAKPLVDADMRIATIGASFYSLLMCYLVLRFCIKLLKGSREETFRQIVRLCVLAFVAILVFAVFDVIEFADTVKKMPKTDTADRAFAVWKGTFSAITQLGLAVTLLLTGLIVRRYRIDGATEANEKRVRKFTVFCVVAIVLYLLGVAVFNVGQLLCINRLLSFDISLILPVSELVVIAFIPAALHMMRETREVKEENSLYI